MPARGGGSDGEFSWLFSSATLRDICSPGDLLRGSRLFEGFDQLLRNRHHATVITAPSPKADIHPLLLEDFDQQLRLLCVLDAHFVPHQSKLHFARETLNRSLDVSQFAFA